MKQPDSIISGNGPVLVLGMGRSGIAATRLLLSQRRTVTVIDDGDASALAEQAAELRALGIGVLIGKDAAKVPPVPYALAVVSPGVRADAPWLTQLAAKGIPAISELELGWRSTRSRILAVTGSNGKSTLASLCHTAMASAGRDTRIGGNFGDPLSELALRYPAADWLVVEVSSFQMETSPEFHPEVGIWLNLHPTHLDRHGNMERYAALKARMFLNMTSRQQAILFENAERDCSLLRNLQCRKTTFGLSVSANVWYHNSEILWHNENGEVAGSFSVAGTMFDNRIMGPTAAAAVAAAQAVGIEPACVKAAIASLRPLPHRLQNLGCIRGVRFVNDAKSTNLDAMAAALEMVGGRVRLLAGGRLQQTVTDAWNESLRNRAVAVYLWGEAAAVLADLWSATVTCRIYGTLEQAVDAAWRDAQTGESVLLSPGCSSHDQYRNFNERGEAFVDAVNRIKQGVKV